MNPVLLRLEHAQHFLDAQIQVGITITPYDKIRLFIQCINPSLNDDVIDKIIQGCFKNVEPRTVNPETV